MASATDIITYIGIPLAVLGVLPLLYNTVQCLIIRHRLLRSLPASARRFFHLNANPVGGNVACTFRKPTFDFEDLWDDLKRCHASIHVQLLPYVESQLLGASWMRLIRALALKPKGKNEFRRDVVDSSLNIQASNLTCVWKSAIPLVLGLGVSPLDPALLSMREAVVAGRQSSRPPALCSDNGKRLIEPRWREGELYLRLTDECSAWSIRRVLSCSLHLIAICDGKREIFHFMPATSEKKGTSTVGICDCEYPFKNRFDGGIFRNIHCTLTWTFHFEGLRQSNSQETIYVPQQVLLSQFKIIEELRHVPTESLEWRVSDLFPSNSPLVGNVMSALRSIWNCTEHRPPLDKLKYFDQRPGPHNQLRNSPLKLKAPELDIASRLTHATLDSKSLEPENAIGAKATPADLYSTEDGSCICTKNTLFEFFSSLQNHLIFKRLSSAYSLSSVVASRGQRGQDNPSISTDLNIDDQTRAEALLARLIIALSAMRFTTVPKGWTTSIASGEVKYKVGLGADEDAVRKLMEYDGLVKIE